MHKDVMGVGAQSVRREDTMPSYEIYYRDQGGRLVEKFSVHCASSKQAKIMAHAMKAHPFAEIEVWLDDALVYERPVRQSFSRDCGGVA